MAKAKKQLTAGRPSEYDPSMCQKVIDTFADGGFIPQACVVCGIKSKTTFYKYVKDYPEFAEAYETAKLHGQAYWEGVLGKSAVGKLRGGQTAMIQTILTNHYKDDYSKDSKEGGTNIHIGVLNQNKISNMSSEDLNKLILEKSKALGIDTIPISIPTNIHKEEDGEIVSEQ